MKNLTAEQQRMFESLVSLGDSKELALKTVLELKVNDSEMYYAAYNI